MALQIHDCIDLTGVVHCSLMRVVLHTCTCQLEFSTYRYAQPDAFRNSFFVARRQLVLAAEQCAINIGGHQIETSVCLTHGSLSPLYSPGSACAWNL